MSVDPAVPTIAVVIPTHNRPALLAEALDCVMSQSRRPDEVIVVNNGSGPLEGALPASVKVLDIMPNAGASQARNFGALAAACEYVAFLDDDDLWEPDYLGKVEEVACATGADMIVTRLDKLVDGTVYPYRDVSQVPDLYTKVLVTNPGVGGPNTVVRRSSFLRAGGYDTQLTTSEDRSLYLEFHRRGLRIELHGHIQAIAREHGSSRLTNPATMAEGKRRFLLKHGREMPPAIYHHNLANINFQLFRSSKSPFHLIPLGWHLLLARLRGYRAG